MPSILPTFEYDIFISYRHNDNRSGWVTEFVNALQEELAGTIKEPLSIYFDKNPHDGLLETHNVDKSLEGKLKCLIFIPIISQTYCDPKSFAWQHEFVTFNKLSQQDSLGRDIKLGNGNVASRILPIKIHDLDATDKALIETELGGVLRAIEFIYKEPGVNRPLKSNDNKVDNQNKTDYRNQTNKVANAIKELIQGIQHPSEPIKKTIEATNKTSAPTSTKRKLAFTSIFIALVCLAMFLFYYLGGFGRMVGKQTEKSIAVLPFKNIGSDGNDVYFSDGMTEEVINYLAKVKELKVMSRTSVEQYKGGSKDIRTIANELNVATILEGSVRKVGNKFRISVQLIEAETGFHLWSHEYDKEITDVLQVQSEIAKEVTDALSIVLSPTEKQVIGKSGKVDMVAYDFYLKARSELMNHQLVGGSATADQIAHVQKAMSLFKKSIEADPTFAKAYSGLGLAYYQLNFFQNYFKEGFLDSLKILADQSLQLDLQNEEAFYLKGIYYQQHGKMDEAIDEYNKALAINPNFGDAMMQLSYIYLIAKQDVVMGMEQAHKAIEVDRGPGLANNLNFIGNMMGALGLFDKSKAYFSMAASLNGDSAGLYYWKGYVERTNHNYEAAYQSISKACGGLKTDSWSCTDQFSWMLQLMGKYKEALDIQLQYEAKTKNTDAAQLGQLHRIGWLFSKTGNKAKAKEYFDKMIDYGNESIRLNREYAQIKSAHYDLAGVYAFRVDKEKAYQYLDTLRTLKIPAHWMVQLLKERDPLFESLRQEVRYKNIVEEMEAKLKAQQDKVQQWLDKEEMRTKVERKLN